MWNKGNYSTFKKIPMCHAESNNVYLGKLSNMLKIFPSLTKMQNHRTPQLWEIFPTSGKVSQNTSTEPHPQAQKYQHFGANFSTPDFFQEHIYWTTHTSTKTLAFMGTFFNCWKFSIIDKNANPSYTTFMEKCSNVYKIFPEHIYWITHTSTKILAFYGNFFQLLKYFPRTHLLNHTHRHKNIIKNTAYLLPVDDEHFHI